MKCTIKKFLVRFSKLLAYFNNNVHLHILSEGKFEKGFRVLNVHETFMSKRFSRSDYGATCLDVFFSYIRLALCIYDCTHKGSERTERIRTIVGLWRKVVQRNRGAIGGIISPSFFSKKRFPFLLRVLRSIRANRNVKYYSELL